MLGGSKWRVGTQHGASEAWQRGPASRAPVWARHYYCYYDCCYYCCYYCYYCYCCYYCYYCYCYYYDDCCCCYLK